MKKRKFDTTNQEAPIQKFPNELLVHIFGFFNCSTDLSNVAQTCKRFKFIVDEHHLLSRFAYTDSPKITSHSANSINSEISSLDIIPNGEILYGTLEGEVVVLDFCSEEKSLNINKIIFRGNKSPVYTITHFDDELVAFSAGDLIQIYDINTKNKSMEINIKNVPCDEYLKGTLEMQKHSIFGLKFLPNKNLVSVIGFTNSDRHYQVHVLDINTGKSIKHLSLPLAVAISISEKHIALSTLTGIVLLNSQTLEIEERLEGHTAPILALENLANGNLASGSCDKTIRIWDTNTHRSVVLTGHTSAVEDIKSLPNGDFVSSSKDTLQIWNGKTYECKNKINANVNKMGILPSGELVTLDRESGAELKVWSFASLKTLDQERSLKRVRR